MTKIAAIQMCSSHNIQENLQTAANLITQAASAGAKLVVLPEMFAIMGIVASDKVAAKEKIGHGPIQNFLSEQSKRHNIWIVGGTIPIETDEAARVRATCLVYNNEGMVVKRYDKIHLFDVSVSKNETYQESDTTQPGSELAVIDSPVGKLGLSVCYDIRFPELFRCLFKRGAEILMIPSAFTAKTGEAHWELLARARAVENFSYVIGACQGGTHTNNRKTYGHSIIVDPWGKIIASLASGTGVITAEIDLEHLHKIRQSIPITAHQRIFCDTPQLNDKL